MKSFVSLWAVCASFTPVSLATTATESPHVLAVNELQTTITKAITSFEATQLRQWSFQVERYENEEGEVTSSIERFSPQQELSQQWQLIEINKRMPTADEQDDFQRRKQDAEVNISLRLSELIQTDSLAVVSEDSAYISASFNVYLKRLGADASKHLQGTLTFAKQGEFIEHIEITNTDSFSPMFAATIDTLSLNMAFVKIDQAILTQRIDLKMQGSFALFTEIDEVSSDVFSDYQYIGPCTFNC